MPHNLFDNLNNQITIDDLTVALIAQSQIHQAAPPEQSPENTHSSILENSNNSSIMLFDDQQQNNNNTNIFSSNNFMQDSTDCSYIRKQHELQQKRQSQLQNYLQQQQGLPIEETFIQEQITVVYKDIMVLNDLTNQTYKISNLPLQSVNNQINFQQLLQQIKFENAQFNEDLKEKRANFFFYDPVKGMYINLPTAQKSFLSTNFISNIDFLKLKFICPEDRQKQQQLDHIQKISPLSEKEINQQRENQITEQFFKNLQAIKPMPRVKERSISFALENLQKWRQYQRNGIYHQGIHIKLNLNQAAQILEIKRKTLDEYNKQIKDAKERGFDFQANKNEKIGVLRKFNKNNKNVRQTQIQQQDQQEDDIFNEINQQQQQQMNYDEDFALQNQLEYFSDEDEDNQSIQLDNNDKLELYETNNEHIFDNNDYYGDLEQPFMNQQQFDDFFHDQQQMLEQHNKLQQEKQQQQEKINSSRSTQKSFRIQEEEKYCYNNSNQVFFEDFQFTPHLNHKVSSFSLENLSEDN